MAYITKEQLKERLGETLYARLTDRESGATADDSVGQQIVDDAEALADSQLARRYATPIDLTAHPELTDVLAARVLDIAEYRAWRDSPFVNDVPERIRFLYEDTMRWFSAVAVGQLDLPAASLLASPTAVDDSPRYVSRARKFTEEELDGL